MDTSFFLVSAAALITLGYSVFWTIRAVRRVGFRRFARALGQLVGAVVMAGLRLFLPQKEASDSMKVAATKPDHGAFVAADQDGSTDVPAPRPGFNISTEQLDDGVDPGGVYLYGGYNGDDV